MKIGRYSTVAVLFGTLLSLAGGAQAFALPPAAGGGVSWESLGTLALGLVVSLVGAYVKGLQANLVRTNEKVDRLSESLSGDHYDKEEAAQVIAAAIAPVQVELKHIGKMLESLTGQRPRRGFADE